MSGTPEEPTLADGDEDDSNDSDNNGPDGTSIGANHGEDNVWDDYDGDDSHYDEEEDVDKDEEDNNEDNDNEDSNDEEDTDYNDNGEGGNDNEEGDDHNGEGDEDQQPGAYEQVHSKTRTRTKAGPRAVEHLFSYADKRENPIQCVELFDNDEEETDDEEEGVDEAGQQQEVFRPKRIGKRPYTEVTLPTNVTRLPPRHNYASESDDDSIDSLVTERRSGKRQRRAQPDETSSEEDNGGDHTFLLSTRLWNKSYSSLVGYLKEHKEWPNTKTNRYLAWWVSDQQHHKLGNRPCLTNRRVARLTRLGISWEVGVPHNFVCPIESVIEHIREWMHQYMML